MPSEHMGDCAWIQGTMALTSWGSFHGLPQTSMPAITHCHEQHKFGHILLCYRGLCLTWVSLGLKLCVSRTAFLLQALAGLFPCLDPFSSFWRMPLASGPSSIFKVYNTSLLTPFSCSYHHIFSLATAMTALQFQDSCDDISPSQDPYLIWNVLWPWR